eukprot:2078479-Rhodomonas_salina.1
MTPMSQDCTCLPGFHRVGHVHNFSIACRTCPRMAYCSGDNTFHACPARTHPDARRSSCLCYPSFTPAAPGNGSGTEPYPASCDCDAGRYVHNESFCGECPQDFYCPTSNTYAPTACPQYSSSPPGAASVTECRCSENFIFDAETAACVCPEGFFLNASDACTRCPRDHICETKNTLSPTQCPAAFHAPAGSAAPGNCTACTPPNSSLAGVVCTCPPVGEEEGAVQFPFTGEDAAYTVPLGATAVRFFVWGGGGGAGDKTDHFDNMRSGWGGGGGFVTGVLRNLHAHQQILVQVGAGGFPNALAPLHSHANNYSSNDLELRPWPDGGVTHACASEGVQGASGGASSRIAVDGEWVA